MAPTPSLRWLPRARTISAARVRPVTMPNTELTQCESVPLNIESEKIWREDGAAGVSREGGMGRPEWRCGEAGTRTEKNSVFDTVGTGRAENTRR